MNLEPIESTLARYEPAGPRAGLRDELVGFAIVRNRRRHRMRLIAGLAAALVVTAGGMVLQANRTYDEAIGICKIERPKADTTAQLAGQILSTQLPGAQAALRMNGGTHE